jgi:hypothetical protein
MSREVQFSEGTEDFEYEDAISVQETLLLMESTLRPYLDAERDRLKAEVDFLKSVYSGVTRGSAIETASSIYVDWFLDSTLRRI